MKSCIFYFCINIYLFSRISKKVITWIKDKFFYRLTSVDSLIWDFINWSVLVDDSSLIFCRRGLTHFVRINPPLLFPWPLWVEAPLGQVVCGTLSLDSCSHMLTDWLTCSFALGSQMWGQCSLLSWRLKRKLARRIVAS